jgi:hypothetical protein
MAILLDDECRFIEFSQSCMFMSAEHLNFDRS